MKKPKGAYVTITLDEEVTKSLTPARRRAAEKQIVKCVRAFYRAFDGKERRL